MVFCFCTVWIASLGDAVELMMFPGMSTISGASARPAALSSYEPGASQLHKSSVPKIDATNMAVNPSFPFRMRLLWELRGESRRP
jgi:hypothetical protein